MKRETAWLMGSCVIDDGSSGSSIWNNYGALLRWTEPALPLTEKQLAPRTLTYKQVGNRILQLDLYYPPGEGPFPVAIYAHGGAFVRGERDDMFCFSPIVDRLLELRLPSVVLSIVCSKRAVIFRITSKMYGMRYVFE